jgi:YidC/Oxa1 family membrane protein insertase
MSTIIGPFAKIFGWILAAFFSVTHNYALAIILLTLVTMVAVFPLTRKGTRSMMQMQLLQPELLKMRARYKKTPGMTAEEKREIAQQQQTEMMALYRENGVSPTGGCLPMVMQFPVFIVLYSVIRGMTRTVPGKGKGAAPVYDPLYINHATKLYQSLSATHGKMEAFGLNLADSVRTHQPHWVDVIPYVVVILIAVGLQYVSIWQITNRNPSAANANPQMQTIQKFMPLIFIVIYINFGAGVGLYFIVSSLFRIAQQEWMYKRDPHITKAVAQLVERQKNEPPPTPGGPKKSFRQKLLEASGTASLEPAPNATRPGTRPVKPGGGRPQPGRPQRGPATGGKPGQGRPNSGAKPGPGVKPGARPGAKPGGPAGQGGAGQGGAGQGSQKPGARPGPRPGPDGQGGKPVGGGARNGRLAGDGQGAGAKPGSRPNRPAGSGAKPGSPGSPNPTRDRGPAANGGTNGAGRGTKDPSSGAHGTPARKLSAGPRPGSGKGSGTDPTGGS